MGEVHSAFVFRGEEHLLTRYGPLDGQGGVVEADGALRIGGIGVVDFIGKYRLGAEHEEAVGKASGNEELALVVLAQLHLDVPTEGGAATPEVDSHIEHTAGDNPHKFRLTGGTSLIMQATQHAKRRFRLIVLNEGDLATDMAVEIVLPICFHEIAPGIAIDARLQHENSLNFCLDILHREKRFRLQRKGNKKTCQGEFHDKFFAVACSNERNISYFCGMNEFALCIEYLLLDHDHVAVPGLGTFISLPREAAYDAGEETLLPPSRQVRFRVEAKQEDVFFVSAIRQIYGLTGEEAEGKLSVWTSDFSQTLAEQGCVDMGSIGTFTVRDDQIAFSPTQAGVTTPDYYALDTLHIQEIGQRKTASVPIIRTDAKRITISINRRIANYVAAACVAIVLFFALSTPAGNTQLEPLQEISASALFMPRNLTLWLGGTEERGTTEVKSTGSRPTDDAQAMPAGLNTGSSAPSGARNEAETHQAEPPYCIVVASAIPQRNAERLVQELAEQGCAQPRILEGKVLRVAEGEYNNEVEARAAVREIHKKGGDYEYAWVYERK